MNWFLELVAQAQQFLALGQQLAAQVEQLIALGLLGLEKQSAALEWLAAG